MPNISEQSLEDIVFIINGCKLLTIFQRVFKEPIKVVHLQELAKQPRFNGVVETEMISNSFALDISTKHRQIPLRDRHIANVYHSKSAKQFNEVQNFKKKRIYSF